jgi:hypothetical protein
MYSDVSVVNVGLTLIGEPRIVLLTEDTKQAREAKALYEATRNALLAAHNWSFAKTRVQLSPDPVAPLFEFANKYILPGDCVRVVRVGDHYVGADLTDYRGSPVEEYAIEGRTVYTNMDGVLDIVYIKIVTDASQFAPGFAMALGAKMGANLSGPLNQSNAKKQTAEAQFDKEIRAAIRANAIELPPTKLADDEWVLSRI